MGWEDEEREGERMALAAWKTEEAPEEYTMRCLMGDVEGHEYMNTVRLG